MSPFINNKVIGGSPLCYRKSKCLLLIIVLGSISFLVVAMLYSLECSPLTQNCSHHIVSPNAAKPRLASSISEKNRQNYKPDSTRPNINNNDALVQRLIELNKHSGQRTLSISMNNLINFTSLQQDGIEFKIDQNDVMVFLHIQKTGGTTFERHLVQDIDLEAPCTCRKKKRKKIVWDAEGSSRKWFAGGCECFRPSSKSDTFQTKSSWLFSRYNTGWKCGLHADWTELTECVDSYLDTEEGVTNRR